MSSTPKPSHPLFKRMACFSATNYTMEPSFRRLSRSVAPLSVYFVENQHGKRCEEPNPSPHTSAPPENFMRRGAECTRRCHCSETVSLCRFRSRLACFMEFKKHIRVILEVLFFTRLGGLALPSLVSRAFSTLWKSWSS